MKLVKVRDMVLFNVFGGGFLLLCAAFYFYAGWHSEELARAHRAAPDVVANVYYTQGAYDKLRDTAVSCSKFQDEMFIASLRASAKGATDNAFALLGLAAILLLNGWYMRALRTNEPNGR